MGKSIIQVQYPDKYREGEFGGRPYTYYLDAGLSVSPGDVITVPTKFGHTQARVSKINMPDGVIDERWSKDVRTITAADLETEPRTEKLQGENVKQARTPAGFVPQTPEQVSFGDAAADFFSDR